MSSPAISHAPAPSTSIGVDYPNGYTYVPRLPNGNTAIGTKEQDVNGISKQPGSEERQRSKKLFKKGAMGIFDFGRKSEDSRNSGSLKSEEPSTPSKRQRKSEDIISNATPPTSTRWSNDSPYSFNSQWNGVTNGNDLPVNGLPQPDMELPGSGHVERGVNNKGKERASQYMLQPSSTPNSNRSADAANGENHGNAYAAPIDQNQLIQMALNLSESRRLNLGPGQLASSMGTIQGRSVSGTVGQSRSGPQGVQFGGSLRRSRQVFNGVSLASPRTSNVSNFTAPEVNELLRTSVNMPEISENPSMSDQLDVISSGTLLRAEKARLHFELAHEYRRLLSTLPPIKPKTWSGAQSMGRAYNALQYIRNRQIRSRDRQTIDADGAGWNNLEAVKLWVDMVEVEAQDENNSTGDVHVLPYWNSKLRHSSTQSVAPWAAPASPDPNTSLGKPKYEKLDWSLSPADLLADTYWLEQGRNKAMIENRDGARIFEHFQEDTTNQKVSKDLFPPLEEEETAEDIDGARLGHHRVPSSNRASISPPPFHSRRRASTARSRNQPAHPEGRVARVKRHLLRRHHDDRRELSDSDVSDVDDPKVQNFRKRGASELDNTGPLEKHMRHMLESDPHSVPTTRLEKSVSDQQDDGQQRRGGLSADALAETTDKRNSRRFGSLDMSAKGSVHTRSPDTPRISIEDIDAGQRFDWNAMDSSNEQSNSQTETTRDLKARPRAWQKENSAKDVQVEELERIETTDFADTAGASRTILPPLRTDQLSASDRSGSASSLRKIAMVTNAARDARNRGSKESNDFDYDESSSLRHSYSSRFFKGGRIGDIVRNERPRLRDFAWKRGTSKDEPRSVPGRESWSSGSDPEDQDHPLMLHGRDRRRSRSATDLPNESYTLPTFKSAKAQRKQNDQDGTSKRNHLSKLQKPRPSERRSRYDDLTPLQVGLHDSSSNNPALVFSTHSNDHARTERFDREPSPGDDRPRSTSGTRASDGRLKTILASSGGVGKNGIPLATSLAHSETSSNSKARNHHWSIADGISTSRRDRDRTRSLNMCDIKYVETLLLTTGIKARSIGQRADEIRSPPSRMVIEASRLCKTTPTPVKRREEHVVAARLLSRSLESSVTAFEEEAERFRSQTCTQLQSRMDDVREKLGSRLTPLVRTCADDADAFIARLTTTHTLSIKQVNDSIDQMLRNRRRRLRWFRNVGFKTLEWVLVGIMWWIWLFVYILGAIKSVVVGFGRGVRWVFWSS